MDLAFYDPADEPVLPSAARQPWTVTGAGGTLQSNHRIRVIGSATPNRYARAVAGAGPTSRMEIQASFTGITNEASISGHLVVIDDGARAVGVAIGDELAFVVPSTGARILTISPSWGWTRETRYHLIKRGTTSWDIYADGRLLKRLPYEAAAAGGYLVSPGTAWGWFDSTTGSGDWRLVESGVDLALPPQHLVDRMRASMPGPLQARWTRRHTALLRAMVGTTELSMDQARGIHELHTAAMLELESTAWDGASDPVDDSWVETSSGVQAFPGSTVRKRQRLTGQAQEDGWTYTFATPQNPADMVLRVRARVYLRAHDTVSTLGRVGPFLRIEDGNKVLDVLMLHSGEAHEAIGWRLCTGDLSGPAGDLGTWQGEDLHLCDPEQDEGTEVEVYVIGRTRVVLFVDGHLVEDAPYSQLSGATSTANYAVQIGVAGDSEFTATVDYEDVESGIAHADLHQRPEFIQRLQERTIFVGGCERPDQLEVWSRHRFGVFEARGSSRAMNEVRRVTCDDDAQLVVSTQPSEWYLERTYPEVTPIFLESDDIIVAGAAEFGAKSPNLTPAELAKVIQTYLLPRSVIESQFAAYLATKLTAATVTTSTTAFTVEDATGFEAGDAVELRGDATDGANTPDLDLTYAVGSDRSDVSIRDLSGGGAHGTLVGGSTLQNGIGLDPVIASDSPGFSGGGVTTAGYTPDIAGSEVTIAAWFRWVNVSNDYLWSTNSHAIDGGTMVRVLNSGADIEVNFYNAIGAADSTTFVGALSGLATGDWFHVAVVLNATTFRLYVNGVQVGSPTTLTITPATPTTPGFRWGGTGANTWLADKQDLIAFDRELVASEVLALYNGIRRAPPRQSPDLHWAGRAYPAALCRWSPDSHQAEHVRVGARDGHVWAAFETTTDGQAGLSATGESTTYAGLVADKVADITAATVVNVAGGGTYVATVVGLDATNSPALEEIAVTAGSPAVGSQTWNEVHGVYLSAAQGTDVDVDDNSNSNLLYRVTTGQLSEGLYLFDPPYRAHYGHPLVVDSSTALSVSALVVGHQYGDSTQVLEADFAGGAQATLAQPLVDVRALAVGYVSGAATLDMQPGLATPAGTIRVTSSNAADGQTIRSVFLDETGELVHEDVTLSGTTPVLGARLTLCFLGAYVVGDALPVGDVTIESYEGAAGEIVTLGTITAASGEESVGARRLRLDLIPSTGLELRLEVATSRPFLVAVVGRDVDGSTQVQAVEVQDTKWLDIPGTWSHVEALCVAHLPSSSWVRLRGTLWRFGSMNAALLGLQAVTHWTASTDVPTPDAKLDDDTGRDVALGSLVQLTAEGSKFERTTITSIDPITGDVVVPALFEDFAINDIMRKVT